MFEPARHSRPRKRFGQHFLETAWAQKVVAAIAPDRQQTFLEIGPGRGAITRPLAAAARHLLAFEIDRDLASNLEDAAIPNLRVITGDFLDATVQQVQRELDALPEPPGMLRIAGNLPYNVASPILLKVQEMAEGGLPVDDATFMLQREVADRLTARPGTKDYGVLTILTARRAAVERLLELPAGAFRPPPRVQSTLVRLRFHAPSPRLLDSGVFEGMTQALFTQRRKTLANALGAYPPAAEADRRALLTNTGIDPQRRPETLTLEEVGRLSDAVFRLLPP